MESSLFSMAWVPFWQVTLLVLAVAVLVRLVARNRPHLAYALWLVVLVKCVTPPLFASPSGVFCWLQPARQVAVAECEALEAPVPLAAPAEELVIPLYPVELAETPTATEPLAAERSRPLLTWNDAAAFALLTWAIGAAVSLAMSVWRWRACLRRAGTVQRGEYAEFERSVGQLARRVGLRRSVRVLITRSPFGPAVTGLLRPTLLMPEGLLAEKTPAELKPLLAHELIHIRRGDLWAGLLQTIVLSLWWFHPLIRWAVRQSMAKAERCCDEAVLAELRCRPRQYAQSLLSVLQYKMEWAPAAAFPGAGRIGGTSKRLERIMRLGQGCRRRSPWWCWLVMVGTAAVVLPGGTFVASGGELGNRRPTLAVPDPARQESVQSQSGEPLEVQVSFLSGPRKAIQSLDIEWNCLLSDEIDEGYQPPPEEFLISLNEKLRANPTPSTDELMKRLARRRDSVLMADHDRSADKQQGPPVTRVRHVVGKHTPMRYALLDEEEAAQLVEQWQAESRVTLTQAPRVFLVSGQTACVSNTSQSPFVINVKPITGPHATALQPVIRIVEEGTKLKLHPTMQKGGSVRLDYQTCMACIQKVDTCSFKVAGMENPATVQVPVVETMQVDGSNILALGSTLVIAGLERPQSDAEAAAMPQEGTLKRLARDTLGIARPGPKAVSQLILLRVQKPAPKLPKNEAGTEQPAVGR